MASKQRQDHGGGQALRQALQFVTDCRSIEPLENYLHDEGDSVPGEQQTRPAPMPVRQAHPLFIGLAWGLVVLSFVTGGLLLFYDFASSLFPGLSHSLISAAPLLLIGAASLAFQVIRRPGLLDLFKAMIVSLAFLLWGVDQLLPAGWLATALGDVVIILYVIDLGWMIADVLKSRSQNLS